MANQIIDEAENKRIDAFILYNEQEKIINIIVDKLESNNISTHFWRRDVSFGDPILELEEQRFREADKILVFLGDWGWGQTHLRYAEQAQKLEKRIIPILIGNPQEEELDKANGLFRNLRRIDLRDLNDEGIQQLLNEFPNRRFTSNNADIQNTEKTRNRQNISSAVDNIKVDELINDLIDGDETKRFDVLRRILTTNIDRVSLAARLRKEIRENFSPENEKNYSQARRSPIEIPSIRSWMLSALIRSDTEHEESRKLLLRHVDESYESHNFVRYWTLAGLYNRQVSYLDQALELTSKDSKRELVALTQAIESRNNPEIIEVFRKQLSSSSYDDVWAILRVLRVIPIPQLTEDVCRILIRSDPGLDTAYDALQALSTEPMAVEAVKRFEQNPGIERILNYVLMAIAKASSDYVVKSFTVLLTAFEPSDLHRALNEAKNNPETHALVSQLRRHLKMHPEKETINEIYAASYEADTSDEKAIKRDSLGIQKDVQTLCAVMISKTVKPPLAIGLFGDWGTGKSFFIQSMIMAIKGLAENHGNRFCSNVVQIEFNAWHYSDTNLWASLASYILTQLAAYVAPPEKTEEEKQAALLLELNSAKSIVKEAESQKTNAQNLIAEQQEKLQKLQTQRQIMEMELSDLRMSDLTEVLKDNPEIEKNLTQSFHDIGIPAAFQNFSDLKQAVNEAFAVRGQATAMFLALREKMSWGIWALLFLLILAIPALFYLATKYLQFDNWIVTLSAIFTQIAGFIAVATKVVRDAVSAAKASLDKIEEAKKQVDRLITAKRQNQLPEETELQNKIASLRAAEEEASIRVTTAVARIVELEERIRAIREGRSLARFLVERTSSEDYRKHLGIISTIRQDLDSLKERLDEASKDENVGFKKVDRIILYIDDLDRCASDKVMDVLQAVHLLLAYPLFVVVVGVDPRWLLHSLETTHSAFQNSQMKTQSNANVWQTTPQNYLEKIFQIPFNLKPMTSSGYGKLIDGLFAVPAVEKSEENSYTDKIEDALPSSKASITSSDDTALSSESDSILDNAGQETENNQSDTETPKPDEPPLPTKKPTAEAAYKPTFIVYEEALIIKDWESDFAKKLFALIPTPRAAKRFSNIYRLLKAGVPRQNVPQFEGTQNDLGDFRIPMLLLAMLIGGTAECTVLFPELQQVTARDGDLTEALKILKKTPSNGTVNKMFAENSKPFVEKVERIVKTQSIPNLSGVYIEWIPRVARFSFDVGRVIKAASDESSDELFY